MRERAGKQAVMTPTSISTSLSEKVRVSVMESREEQRAMVTSRVREEAATRLYRWYDRSGNDSICSRLRLRRR